MATTVAQIERLRRMVSEPEDATHFSTYDDATLAGYIEEWPLNDSLGNEPDESAWTATYDLHRTAAAIWEEKAAAVAQDYDFTADGGSFSRSKKYEQYMKAARRHMSRARVETVTITIDPPLRGDDVGDPFNYNDPYDWRD